MALRLPVINEQKCTGQTTSTSLYSGYDFKVG